MSDQKDLDELNCSQAVYNAAAHAHRLNRLYCQAIGDDTQLEWEDCPDWQAASAVSGAQAIADDPSTTPEQSHEEWLSTKRGYGWTFGEVKDAEKKIHPCMVPYDELPATQRHKDAIFGAVVRGVLEYERGK